MVFLKIFSYYIHIYMYRLDYKYFLNTLQHKQYSEKINKKYYFQLEKILIYFCLMKSSSKKIKLKQGR
jgi:hypothetical protein